MVRLCVLTYVATVVGVSTFHSLPATAQSEPNASLAELQSLMSSSDLNPDEISALNLALGTTSVQDLENQFADRLATSYTLNFAGFNANPGEVAGKEEALDFLRRAPGLVGSATDKLIAASGGGLSEGDIQNRINRSGVLGAYDAWQKELDQVSVSGIDRSKLALRGISIDARNAIGALGALGEAALPVDDFFESADLASVALRAGNSADKGLTLIGGIAKTLGSVENGRITWTTILELTKLLESSGYISDGEGAWSALQDLSRGSDGLAELRELQSNVTSARALRALQRSEDALIKKQLSNIGQIVKLLSKPFPGLGDVVGFAAAFGKAEFESAYNQQAAQLIVRNLELGFDLEAGQEYFDEFSQSQLFIAIENDLQGNPPLAQISTPNPSFVLDVPSDNPLTGQGSVLTSSEDPFATISSLNLFVNETLTPQTGQESLPPVPTSSGEENPPSGSVVTGQNSAIGGVVSGETASSSNNSGGFAKSPNLQTVKPTTSTQLGFITAANATPTSTFLLTHGALATVTDNGSVPTTFSSTYGSLAVSAENPAASNYQYLSWGAYSGPVAFTDPSTGIAHQLNNLRWMHGETTPADYFLNKSGSASWAGKIYGDYALKSSNDTFHDAVTGDLNFSIDFSDNSVVGTLVANTLLTWPNGQQTSFAPRNFTLSGNFVSGTRNGISSGGISTLLSGSRLSGELGGAFFGPNAEEFGGTFWYTDPDGGASGVVVARHDPNAPNLTLPMQDVVYTMDRDYRCVGIGCGYSRILQDAVFGQWSVGAPVETTTIVGKSIALDQQLETATGSKPTISSTTLGDYSYTSWGIWRTEDYQRPGLKGTQKTEYWIAGQATHPDNLPRSGTAQYNGEMMGTIGGRKRRSSAETRVNGAIQFNADFAAETISGNYQVPGWASGNIPAININKGNGKAQFTGSMQHTSASGSATLSGTFFGPKGEEVGGVWNGNNVGGVFRAKQ